MDLRVEGGVGGEQDQNTLYEILQELRVSYVKERKQVSQCIINNLLISQAGVAQCGVGIFIASSGLAVKDCFHLFTVIKY